MLAEPMTLYKLMNLYMLHQVNFPLTNAQLSNFFLDRRVHHVFHTPAGHFRAGGSGTDPYGNHPEYLPVLSDGRR